MGAGGGVRAEEVVQVRGPVVVAGHPEATRVGIEVLRGGGNAMDALVASSLALGVTEPGNSGLGGKLVFVYFDASSREVTFVTALSAAPGKLDVQAAIDGPATERARGWRATCVPGLVAGLGASHEKWGSRPWAELVGPAARLAREGYVLNERAADMGSEFPLVIDGKPVDAAAAAIYAPGGKTQAAGERASNVDLAATLDDLAEHGWRAFYTGKTADRLIAAANAAGWPMAKEDFVGYAPRFAPALSFGYEGYVVKTSPPPLTGGAILAGSMKVLEHQDWSGRATSTRDVGFIDAYARALTQVYPLTSSAAGDTPESAGKVERLLTGESIAKLRSAAAAVDPAKLGGETAPAGPADGRGVLGHPFDTAELAMDSSADTTGDDAPESCTTHLMIVDAAGNVVVATQSLGWHFGSAVVAPGTGVLMNNDMNNFGYRSPGSVNQVAAGKWPRSTMTPTLVLKDNKPVLAIGSPGGARIPVQVGQVLMDVVEFGRPLPEAVKAPRYHVRRAITAREADNVIDLEHGHDEMLAEGLRKLGWQVVRTPAGGYYFGCVNSATFAADGTITGVADVRRSADAAGLNITD